MNYNLQQEFSNLLAKYSDNKILEAEYWEEIEKAYSQKNRYYHNLSHLDNMIDELQNAKAEIYNWDSILFSIFYHDIIYKSTSKDNEEKSANIAANRLVKINVDATQIDQIYQQILATKSHSKSIDSDTNYLLDADLSILGKNWNQYEKYVNQIRKEYSIYPDLIYKPGRKKVLEHFLTFEEIYKTEYFKEKFEKQARENILKEINLL
ncbi:HD domain-containing protein [Faecalibacter bovis]|uniref:Metal-dependent HD superfamily phosphohydrolase n=1 Tax=Faecalibacter bovis TaxID=2898187 RepID=A0ABX7XAV1_9FLAO|nr:hypothetical protein [Faecalibacter bovis]QTV05022.1 hypothetical protein J9309_09500 [Faecalibacter bovis]